MLGRIRNDKPLFVDGTGFTWTCESYAVNCKVRTANKGDEIFAVLFVDAASSVLKALAFGQRAEQESKLGAIAGRGNGFDYDMEE